MVLWGCNVQFKNIKDENKRLKEEIKDLRKENEDLKSRVVAVEEKVQNMELSVDIVEKVKKDILATLKEEEDKKSRQRNLILYGVPESNKPNGKEREDDDLNFAKEFLRRIWVVILI